MRVLLWVILGLTACAVVYGAKPQTAPSSNITTETSPGTATTLSSTLERPKKRHTESTVANSATTPVGEYRRRRRFRKKKKKVSTDFVKLPTTPGQLVTAQVSVTAAVSSPDDVTFGDSSPNAVTIAVSPSTAVTPKPSHHRRRHSRKRSKIHHRRRNSTTTATSGFTPIPESSSTNLTVAAASGATVSKTLATSGEPAASAKSSNAKQERRKDPTEHTDGHEDYTQPDDIAGYYDIDPEPFFTHSLSSLYSTRLGQDPAFSSSENYALYEGANVPDLKRENPRATVTLETVSVPPQRQCYTMQKPMPAYIHYGGKVEKTGATDHGPMMTCRVCGKKEDPFAGGGYTEDCSYSPDKQTNILENYKGIQKYDQPDYADIPFGSATTTQLYAGKGQSPYLNSNSARGHSSKKSHHDYNPYYGNYGGYHEYLPQATGTQTYGGNGGHGSGHGGDGGGKGSGDHGNGAGTGKSTCKIVYRGKMKCKICGDAKSDAIFSEQCDYERNDPGQHRATSYNYGSADDKKYKSPQGKGNGDGYGGGGGGYGGGHGGDFGPSGDDYGFGNNGGYGGDGFGGYNFPDYGGYGSGTGYGLSFDTDPFFGGHGDNYGVSGGGGGGGQGGDKYGGSTASGDGQKYGGSGDSKDYSSQQPQQAGSSQIADKHDNGEGGNKKNCKVIYKDVNSYSPYTKSQGDSKPKMKCMVCSQNNGGVTEECSYNGGGELTSKGAFPDSKDISAFYGSPLDSYYRPAGYDEYRAALF